VQTVGYLISMRLVPDSDVGTPAFAWYTFSLLGAALMALTVMSR
jgi:hypothetical protein